MKALVAFSLLLASVPRELIAAEKSQGSDTLLFCAPEALFISKWRAAFERPDVFERIVAVIVDEDCVSKW